MKKILVIFFDNFIRNDKGSSSYVYNVCKKLKQIGCQIDYLPLRQIWDDFGDYKELNDKEKLISNLYLYDGTENISTEDKVAVTNKMARKRLWGITYYKEKRTENKLKKYFLGIPYYKEKIGKDKLKKYFLGVPYYKEKIGKDKLKKYFLGVPYYKEKKKTNTIKKYIFSCCYSKSVIPFQAVDKGFYGWMDNGFSDYAQKIINEGCYDYIYIHYIQCAELLRYVKIPSSTKLVYQMQDINCMQTSYSNPNSDLGMEMKQEMDLISKFKNCLCIAYDEMWFMQKLIPSVTFDFLPYPASRITLPQCHKDIDLLFLGFDNPYNVQGVKWFLNKVFPFLQEDINCTICGKVWRGLSDINIEQYKSRICRIDFAKDLDELYARTKVAIIPIFGGTGMKIKTIDAMSRGIPIVATSLGVDGFPDKKENGCLVTDDAEQFAQYINRLISDSSFWQKTQEKQNEYFDKYLDFSNYENMLKRVFK